MTRKEAREQAFILMFEYSFSGDSAEELFDIAKEAGLDIDDEFCTRAVSAAIEKIDEMIERKRKLLSECKESFCLGGKQIQ